MRSLGFTGVAVAALMVSQPALADIDSAVGAPPMPSAAMPAPPVAGSMGDPDNRRASSAMQAPMAPTAPNRRLDYVRPAYGFQLPREWMSAEHVVDYREFDLGRPAPGFGWSRYYNDIVLTDQWGRVYDVADYDDRGGRGHSGRRFGSRATDGIAGGVAGAAVGAVAGNLIAGAGSRLAGSLIGGGVGALAGLAIEAAISKKGKRHDRRGDYDEGRYHRGAGVHWGGSWSGGWSGGWSQACNCGGGGETLTTTTTTTHFGGGGGYLVPQRVVYYENVYAPVRTKYRVREAAPTKYRVREEAPVTTGKVRERTKLHTRTY